jgi:hypothetical protein
MRASGVQRTSSMRWFDRFASQALEPMRARFQGGNSSQQPRRVRMARGVNGIFHRSHLHDLSQIHHCHPVGHLSDYPEVMGDE